MIIQKSTSNAKSILQNSSLVRMLSMRDNVSVSYVVFKHHLFFESVRLNKDCGRLMSLYFINVQPTCFLLPFLFFSFVWKPCLPSRGLPCLPDKLSASILSNRKLGLMSFEKRKLASDDLFVLASQCQIMTFFDFQHNPIGSLEQL